MRVAELPLWVRVKRVSSRTQRQHGIDVQRRLTALRTEDEDICALRFQLFQIAQRAGKNCVLFRHRDDIPVIEARRLIDFHAVNHDGDSTGTIALFRNQHRDFVADLEWHHSWCTCTPCSPQTRK